MSRDFLEEIIEESTASDPGFPRRVEAAYERRLFARRLAEARKKLGLTQSEVARRMRSTQPEVSKIEAGGDVRVSTLERYTAVLGRPLVLSIRPAPASRRRGARSA